MNPADLRRAFPLCFPCPSGCWNPDEAREIDRMLHLFQPELVVESGTEFGRSARAFASHGIDVITIDPEPQVPPGTFDGLRVHQVVGRAPEDLEHLVAPLLRPGLRWLYFADGLHEGVNVAAETRWAFEHGAGLVLGHDVALGTVPEAFPLLEQAGYCPVRLNDVSGYSPEGFTGVWLCWPKPKGWTP